MRSAGMWVPTPGEALRIKAYLLSERKATRDFLDVAALADLLGDEDSTEALTYLNLLYEPVGNQTRLTKFAEVCQQEPVDFPKVDLRSYRGIIEPYNDWGYVSGRCRELARRVFLREMEDGLPLTLENFPAFAEERQASVEAENGAEELKP